MSRQFPSRRYILMYRILWGRTRKNDQSLNDKKPIAPTEEPRQDLLSRLILQHDCALITSSYFRKTTRLRTQQSIIIVLLLIIVMVHNTHVRVWPKIISIYYLSDSKRSEQFISLTTVRVFFNIFFFFLFVKNIPRAICYYYHRVIPVRRRPGLTFMVNYEW